MIRQHQPIGGAIALAAALIVTVAPAAWADPPPLAKAEAAIAANSQARPAVRPNPDEQVASARPAHVAVPVAPSPAIQPNPDEQAAITATQSTGPHFEVIDNGGYGFSNTPATIVRVTTPGGFDWGDAGIGAAAGIAVSMLALGLALLVSQRRARRSRGTAAIAN